MVMVSHYDYSFFNSNVGRYFISRAPVIGQSGVSIFFALSGFLITRILIASKSGEHYFKNFYIRRTLRIFPLYYLVLAFYYSAYPYLSGESPTPFFEQIYYWLYLQDFAVTFNWPSNGPGPFWSLSIEEHFYLFWPFLVYILHGKKLFYTIGGLLLLSIGTRVVLTAYHLKVFYFTFSRLDELALGALLAMLNFGTEDKKKAAWCLPVFVIGLLATVFLFVLFSGDALPGVQVIKYCVVAITYSSLIGLVLSMPDAHILKRLLKGRFLLYTGKISYGLYAYHLMCFSLYRAHLKTGYVWLDFILSFAITYIVAGLSYRFIESYFLRLKNRFAAYGKPVSLPPISAS